MHGTLGHFKGLQQRRKQRKEKRDRKKEEKKKLYYQSNNTNTKLNLPILSNSQIRRSKEEIRTKLKKKNFEDLILFVFIITCLVTLLYYFIN